MSNKGKVIDFADELYKRTGVKPDYSKILTDKAVADDDLIIKMAMEIFNVISSSVDSNPIGVIAALQVVANVLGDEYKAKYGTESAIKLVASATLISNQYRPEFKHGKGK